VQAGVLAQIINNLSYNIGHDFYPFGGCTSYWSSFTQFEVRCGNGDFIGGTGPGWELQVVRIGNRLETGPLSDAGSYGVIFSGHIDTPSGSTSMYQFDNVGIQGNDWSDVLYDSGATESNTRIDIPPAWHADMNFAVMSSSEMRAHVLSNAGARPNDRHPAVQAYITEVMNNTGRSVISDTYTMPTLEVNSRRVDTPLNANDPGDCGMAAGVSPRRTRLECFLEQDEVFGARRLEPRWN
jgi:hypothetical protein